MPDIEFVDAGSDGADDEVLEVGHRPSRPRWWGFAALVAVLTVVGVTLALGPSSSPRPTSTDRAVAPSTPPTSAPSPFLTIQDAATSDTAMVADPSRGLVFAASGGSFYAFVPGRAQTVRTVTLDISAADADEGVRLLADGTHSWVWVVAIGGDDVEALAVAHRIAPLAKFRIGGAISGAAVLDGQLYLSTDRVLYRIAVAPDGLQLTTVASVPGAVNPAGIVADPARHRLLFTAAGRGGYVQVRAWSQAHGWTIGGILPMSKGNLAVVGATIWAGGYGYADGRAVLVPVGPRTLHGGRNIAIADYGPGANLQAGQRSLFVRGGGSGAPLWCLAGDSGRVLRRWGNVPGAVATVRHRGVRTTADGFVPLSLGQCPG